MKIGPVRFNTATSCREHATPLTSRLAAAASSTQTAGTESPLEKRLKKQQEAFEALASLPSPKESAMQNASQKVGLLKQRLESLKAMMRLASPEQLKSMASELKSIARELGVAAGQLSGGEGSSSAGSAIAPTVNAAQSGNDAVQTPPTENVQSEASSAESDVKSANATLESAEAAIANEAPDDSESFEEQKQGRQEKSQVPDDVLQSTLTPSTTQPGADQPTGVNASEHALRSILTDAKRAFQEAASELKIRLQEEDKETRRELKKAENDMTKVDCSPHQSESSALYSTLGQLLPPPVIGVSAATISIDIKV
ncbi:hypothetical protein [Vreelandella sp. EE22]